MTKICDCNICGKDTVDQLIDFGPQAVCHHFLKSLTEEDYSQNLVLGNCSSCATVQLTERIPIQNMIARYDWLTCTEPEAHLDELVKTIIRLPGVRKNFKIGGISFKDDSTLDRFKELGFQNTWRADLRTDLSAKDTKAGFESVQDGLTPESVDRLITNYGKSDIFVARHILEHSYDIRQFIKLIKQLVKPDGYIFIEIPDCQKAFENFDYTTIWEQHTAYFTEETFRICLQLNGLSIVHFERIPYSIEDSYVCVAKINEASNVSTISEDILGEEIDKGQKFAEEYPHTKAKLKKFFTDYQRDQGKIAIFGGGHMSCTYLNLFELKDCIEFVADDNPNMRGLFMPGSKLPILESKAVYDHGIKMCLLTLSVTSEEKVIKNNQGFVDQGGEFFSIFPGSQWAMNRSIKV